jgi:hypothetical protein
MDNNFSWSILASTPAKAALPPLYLVPFVLWTREPAGLLQGMGETARDTEGSGRRRVMTTRNTDGQAYTLDEFIEYFKDRSIGTREFEKAATVHESLCHQMDQRSRPGARALEEDQEESNDKTFLAIKNALIRLLDEGEAPAVPLRRRGFKQKNDKLPRRALVWARFLKKMLLLMYNDHNERFRSGRISAIGESA